MSDAARAVEGAGPGESELSRALAPLYREYLRRLEEMAARVKHTALLREPTTRDEAGLLVFGDDGFPLRFDLADNETGSTFEVRSARDDAPALAQLRVGALEVELKPGSWEALRIDCRFDGAPVPEDAVALASLLRAFAELGHTGAFIERRDAQLWSGRIHSFSVKVDGPSICATFDLGSCPPAALDVLLRALDGFGRDRAPIARVIIGGPAADPKRTL